VSLRAWLYRVFVQMPSDQDEPAVALVAPVPRPRDTCPECDSTHFTAGGQAVSAWHDGIGCGVLPAGAVLCCLKCGARWYVTESGLKKPHRDAMPPAWAMRDLQREGAEHTHERAAGEPPKPRTERRPHLADIHRQPPRG
jgi:hypothetical protein